MFRLRASIATSALVITTVSGAMATPSAAAGAATNAGTDGHGGQWLASRGRIPAGEAYDMIGVKVDDHRIMWVGGSFANHANNDRTFIYDVDRQTFRETAPVPLVKVAGQGADEDNSPLWLSAVGVLSDGSVVIVGGAPGLTAQRDAATKLSYRYDVTRDRWTRTGDLPEVQGWVGMPMIRLADGRLLIAGGTLTGTGNGSAESTRAFVYDPRRWTTVAEVDPDTGTPTGRRVNVQGTWDYTRTADGKESQPSEAHSFGNEVLLPDGRVLLAGGHTLWTYLDGKSGASILSTHTDFFDPRTGVWTRGPDLPAIPGEDDQIPGSHGGRANGVCMSATHDGNVVIAGGFTQTDGADFFATAAGRQSILVLKTAADPRRSRFQISPNPIPSGKPSGAYLGGPGRGQLPCYALSGNRVLISGGQSNFGEDLYDTYVFNPNTLAIRRGPDLLHGTTTWAADYGYPDGYQCATISSLEINMHSSLLVFKGDVLVHGGGYDGLTNGFGLPFVEQLNGLGH